MKFLISLLLFIARLSIAAIFVSAGINKLMNYEETASFMRANGFTMIPFFLIGAALLELIAGLSLIIGFKIRWAAFALAAFMIPTTLIFHNFWAEEGALSTINQMMFFKNLAIFGGLIYVMCFGGGKLACDSCRTKTAPNHPDNHV